MNYPNAENWMDQKLKLEPSIWLHKVANMFEPEILIYKEKKEHNNNKTTIW